MSAGRRAAGLALGLAAGCAGGPAPVAQPLHAETFVNRSRGGELNYLAAQIAVVCEDEAHATPGLLPHDGAPRIAVTGEYAVQGDTLQVTARWTDHTSGRTGTAEVRRAFGTDPAKLTQIQREVALRVLAGVDPAGWLVRVRLGNTLRRQGALGEAREVFREAAASAPTDGERARARFLEGYVGEELGDLAGAVTGYRAALVHDPAHHEARFNLALVLERQGQRAEARATLEDARPRRPADAAGPLALAALAEADGDAPAALALYREAVGLAPRAVLPRFNLARALARAERWDEALAEYESVRAAHPGFLPAWLGLGLTQARRGETEAARRHPTQFIASAETDPAFAAHVAEARGVLATLP